MKTKLIGAALALGLATLPLASFAGGVGGGNANSNWTIYGWQNWSYEFVSADVASIDPTDSPDATGTPQRERDFQRINNNAANIGFAASLDTGMSLGGDPIKVNFQCEQFTFHNRLNGFSDFCNRNSKISLSGAFGEIMMGQWLLPYNEMVAQWVDPFYDAGADSHTSIMGSIGYGTLFYNGGFGFAGAATQGFNRRQEEIVQWFSPNWNGFTARIATTNQNGGEETQVTTASGAIKDVDPRIWSMGVAYENDISESTNIWGAITYQQHDEWAAASFACDDSDDTSWRLAGRLIHAFAGGFTLRLSAMYEDLEYEHEDCALAGGILGGNGVAGNETEVEKDSWMVSGKLDFAGPWDIRFSYMDADDLDCDSGLGSSTCLNGLSDSSTSADAMNLGIFYTMPAGTELRVTYSNVDNDRNAAYDFGIGGAGTTPGGENDMFALGIVQWF